MSKLFFLVLGCFFAFAAYHYYPRQTKEVAAKAMDKSVRAAKEIAK